ncbi:MAG TPA: hypothetical protein VMB82_03565, partial [Acidimicrobiales bacterium]|nr:hypothetical protein [Acidimicrobiales bacterium]
QGDPTPVSTFEGDPGAAPDPMSGADNAAEPPGPVRRRLAAPGVLELEDLLSNHLNTRVKVDMGSKRGRVVVEFATLEDLERIYKLMVGSATTLR